LFGGIVLEQLAFLIVLVIEKQTHQGRQQVRPDSWCFQYALASAPLRVHVQPLLAARQDGAGMNESSGSYRATALLTKVYLAHLENRNLIRVPGISSLSKG
jgi:hypothetical protein